jgi:hypothetical protein
MWATMIAMSTRDVRDVRAGAFRPRWVVVGVLAGLVLAFGGYALHRWAGHGDPDPGGNILRTLQSIAVAVPEDATEVSRQDYEAHWDSCDGREGTFGWSDISVIITFKTETDAEVLVSLVDGRMAMAGWTTSLASSTPFGPGRWWPRQLADASTADARLDAGTYDNGQTITWQLYAVAAAHGPHVSGC